MSTTQNPNLWIPVCCERVMRYNMFVQQDGTMYGALVCSVCNKNVILEQEIQPDMSKYGDGARLLTVLGSPRPPQGSRRKAGKDAAPDETL